MTADQEFPRLIDYSDPRFDANRKQIEVLAFAVGAVHGFPDVKMTRSTAGYAIAGSCGRYDAARYSVTWFDHYHNTIHGQSFKIGDEAGARDYFTKLTDPIAVQAKRDECDRLEREVFSPARAERAADLARIEAEKKVRRAAMRKARKGV